MAKRLLYIIWTCLFLLNGSTIYGAPKKFVVVIDAGHGGHDPGAVGKKAKEKTINLNTALKLGKLIEQNCPDVKVVYTRKTDVFIPLNQRAQIANDAKADLFISIHTNALAKGRTIVGAETYTLGRAKAEENLEVAKKENSVILMEDGYKQTYKGFNPNSSESYIIFEFMQDQNMSQSINLAKKIQQQFKKAGRVDKGVHQAGFLVLRETAMPSVLVELGYISTPQEENFLNTADGTTKMARSLYNAFVSYKSGHDVSGFDNNDKVAAQTPATNNEDTDVELHPIRDNSHVTRNTQQPAKETPKANATKEEPASAVNDNAPIFKIQILTSLSKLNPNDRQFKGVKNVDFYRESGKYKYTTEASSNYNEILRKRRELASKFKDCFIIAFRNGEKMDVNEAIRIFKNRKK